MKQLMTIDDLARLMGVRKSYIFRLNYEGRIPGKIVLGRRTVRYDAQVIEQWLRSQQCPVSETKR